MPDDMSGDEVDREPDLAKDRVERPQSPDPLQNHYGKPLIGVVFPSMKYVGRLIIELYEQPGSSDANSLVLGMDPAPGESQADLVKRIAAALPERVKSIPFHS
jgi:hypothetical protein